MNPLRLSLCLSSIEGQCEVDTVLRGCVGETGAAVFKVSIGGERNVPSLSISL